MLQALVGAARVRVDEQPLVGQQREERRGKGLPPELAAEREERLGVGGARAEVRREDLVPAGIQSARGLCGAVEWCGERVGLRVDGWKQATAERKGRRKRGRGRNRNANGAPRAAALSSPVTSAKTSAQTTSRASRPSASVARRSLRSTSAARRACTCAAMPLEARRGGGARGGGGGARGGGGGAAGAAGAGAGAGAARGSASSVADEELRRLQRGIARRRARPRAAREVARSFKAALVALVARCGVQAALSGSQGAR